MKSEYTISFIVPVRNGSATIAATLHSILIQKPYEVIVVDNSSVDSTREIVKGFGNVKYVFHKKQGRSEARNKGARLARGTYLAFIDADVVLEKDWLKSCISYLKYLPVDGLASRVEPKEGNRYIVDRYRRELGLFKSGNTFLSLFTPHGPTPLINTAACVFFKASFQKLGGFDTSLVRHEDLDLSLRMHSQGYLLGGTSSARARVSFCGAKHTSRILSYAARAFEVQYYYPSKTSLPHVNTSLLRSIWQRNHSFRVLSYGLFIEITRNIAFATKLAMGKNREKKSLRTRSQNFLRVSFQLGGRLYAPRKNIRFIFIDQVAYAIFYQPNFNRKFVELDYRCAHAIRKICLNKKISGEEEKILLDQNLFRAVHAR